MPPMPMGKPWYTSSGLCDPMLPHRIRHSWSAPNLLTCYFLERPEEAAWLMCNSSCENDSCKDLGKDFHLIMFYGIFSPQSTRQHTVDNCVRFFANTLMPLRQENGTDDGKLVPKELMFVQTLT